MLSLSLLLVLVDGDVVVVVGVAGVGAAVVFSCCRYFVVGAVTESLQYASVATAEVGAAYRGKWRQFNRSLPQSDSIGRRLPTSWNIRENPPTPIFFLRPTSRVVRCHRPISSSLRSRVQFFVPPHLQILCFCSPDPDRLRVPRRPPVRRRFRSELLRRRLRAPQEVGSLRRDATHRGYLHQRYHHKVRAPIIITSVYRVRGSIFAERSARVFFRWTRVVCSRHVAAAGCFLFLGVSVAACL